MRRHDRAVVGTFGQAQVMVFTTQQTEPAQVIMLENLGVKVFILGDQRVDLTAMMQRLRQDGIPKKVSRGWWDPQ